MTRNLLYAPLMALGFGVLAFGQTATPVKVGIINIQSAIIQTQDGKKAAAAIDAKFEPKRKQVESKQGELQQMEAQYRAGANTMSEEAKLKLMRDIEQRRKQVQRDMDDANAELEQEQGRILQELGQKIMAVIDRYATEHGFALILDVSSPQTPVLYAASAIDITRDIVEQYDKAQSAAAPAAGAPATTPATHPAAAAPKPAAPPKK
ncbi:MAG: OmpH family outer membrane protein [Acidobacteriota bacterium]